MSARNFDDNKPGQVTIHDFLAGPYPARLRIVLHAKGLIDLVDFKLVDLFKGEHKTKEFKEKYNYSSTIPVLEFADGTLMSEVVALTQYVDNLDGNPQFVGKTPLEQGAVHQWTRRVEFEFLEAVSLYFHNATRGLGPTVELYQNKEWGLHQRDRAFKGMHYLDSLLKQRPYIAGDFFSMADITAIAGVIFLGMTNLEIPEDCVNLIAWHKKVMELSYVKEYFATRDQFLEEYTLSE